jgi:hypothetical protein
MAPPIRTGVWIATALGALARAGGNGGAVEQTPAVSDGAFENVSVVRYPGGFGGAPASPESTCNPLADADTLALDGTSHQLSWNFCRFDPPSTYATRVGQRELSDEELASVEQTLALLEAGTAEGMCGADAGFLTLDVQTKTSTELYISRSSCQSETSAGRAPATGIADVWQTLDALSEK